MKIGLDGAGKILHAAGVSTIPVLGIVTTGLGEELPSSLSLPLERGDGS